MNKRPGDGSGGPLIQSVSRALAILTQVALSPNGLTVTEIVEAVGLNRPTAYHLLRTLAHDGYLTRGNDRRYRLGLRVGTLAEAFARQLMPGDFLVPIVHQLAEETGEATYLASRQGIEIVLLAAVPARHSVAVTVPPLGLLPDAHARASGKVVLAYAPDEVRDMYMRTHDLRRLTTQTVTDAEALEDEFSRIRELGYATNREELVPGGCAMAAPIDGGVSPYAIALSAPRDRFEAHFDEYLAVLLELARRASSAAGQHN